MQIYINYFKIENKQKLMIFFLHRKKYQDYIIKIY
jgi:hypothetical protein